MHRLDLYRRLGLACLIALATGQFAAHASDGQRRLEAGLAITNPDTIERLNRVLGVGNLLGGRRRYGLPIYNDNLFAPPKAAAGDTRSPDGYRKIDVSAIRDFLLANIATYESKRIQGSSIRQDSTRERTATLDKQASFPDKVIDAGFFDRVGRFDLVAIVNRIDRTYKDPKSCGELRFVYRLYYEGETIPYGPDAGKIDPAFVRSRLPMTMNLILKMSSSGERAPSCQEIARKWVRTGTRMLLLAPGKQQADFLVSPGGPLNPQLNVMQAQFDRIEFNLQILRAPASYVQDFGTRADYLLAIFSFDGQGRFKDRMKLENQIDREALLGADLKGTPALNDLRSWLLDETRLRSLDQGTIRIPDPYTSLAAVSVSPGGVARSNNQHVYGLFDDAFEQRMRALIDRLNGSDAPLENIKSYDGFYTRMNDISCIGCHQTRSIAGFHLPGADWREAPKANSVFVPGSPHFYGDLPRRKAILAAIAAGGTPDFSTGFSARPKSRFKNALASTELLGGWGAACHVAPDRDSSFKDWTCRAGLRCEVFNKSAYHENIGTCTNPTARIGDPLQIMTFRYGDDGKSYDRDHLKVPARPRKPGEDYVIAHQEWEADNSTGGFPNGMLRRKPAIAACGQAASAQPALPAEAICALVADTGFNDCLVRYPFEQCVQHCARPGFLRACDATNPCRDDYICVVTDVADRGACIPPYFVFQFRVDRHPSLDPKTKTPMLRPLGAIEIKNRIGGLARKAATKPAGC
jgi:hypothetical protein